MTSYDPEAFVAHARLQGLSAALRLHPDKKHELCNAMSHSVAPFLEHLMLFRRATTIFPLPDRYFWDVKGAELWLCLGTVPSELYRADRRASGGWDRYTLVSWAMWDWHKAGNRFIFCD